LGVKYDEYHNMDKCLSFRWNVNLKPYRFFEVLKNDDDDYDNDCCWWLFFDDFNLMNRWWLFSNYDLWIMKWRCFFWVMTIWSMIGDKHDYVLMFDYDDVDDDLLCMIVITWRCKWCVNHEDEIYII